MLEKFDRFFVRANQVFIGAMMMAMFVLVFINVLGRYGIGKTWAAAEEISTFLMIWVAYLGAGLATFPPYKVDSIDMSGAGDTFDGAFAAAYLAGRPVEACMRFANAAAAITTTGLGCVTPVPRRAAIEALMEAQPQV